MKRLFTGLLLAVAFAALGCAPMGTTATLQISSAPPPPAFAFNADPQFNYLADLQVGVIADDSFGYDMFSANGNYYLFSGGYWYRSQSPRGPFEAVDARRVPRDILRVDDHHYRWRNHPQGWHGQQNDANDNQHGNGNGNDRGGH